MGPTATARRDISQLHMGRFAMQIMRGIRTACFVFRLPLGMRNHGETWSFEKVTRISLSVICFPPLFSPHMREYSPSR